MKKPGRIGALATCAVTFGSLVAIPAGGAPAAEAAPGLHGGILRVAVPDDAKFPQNFNPLLPGQQSATAAGTGSLLYEPLMYVNPYTGHYTPMLATAVSWADGNRTLAVQIRKGVKWADGVKFSAADVAFTFNYLKAHKDVDANGIWSDDLIYVRQTGASTVVLHFGQPIPALVPIIVSQLIVPEHIWDKVKTASAFTNRDPVGTGPFLLKHYSPSVVTYTRNPDYWQAGKPYVSAVEMFAFGFPGHAAALLNDGFAYTADVLADPATFVAANPVTNHYWWPVTSTNFLFFNTREAPMNNAAFRRAVAHALNDTVIADRAYFGAIPPATGGAETGVVPSQLSKWVPASVTHLEWKYNPTDAAAILRAAGFKDVNGSLLSPQGKAVPTLRILIGFGWEDYISIAETISEELAPLGIHTIVDEERYPNYRAEENAGSFDMAISWDASSSVNPFYGYLFLLDGDNATDWERYTSVSDTGALVTFATHASPTLQQAAIVSIERDMLRNVPVVALTGRPNFFEYSTKSFTGWPGPSDPYNAGEAPDDFSGGAEQLFLNVHQS